MERKELQDRKVRVFEQVQRIREIEKILNNQIEAYIEEVKEIDKGLGINQKGENG